MAYADSGTFHSLINQHVDFGTGSAKSEPRKAESNIPMRFLLSVSISRIMQASFGSTWPSKAKKDAYFSFCWHF